MSKKGSHILLTSIFVLLILTVLRLAVAPVSVSAQSANVAISYPPQMVVNNNTVYILQNGKLSVYGWEVKGGLGGELTKSLGEAKFQKQAEIDTGKQISLPDAKPK